MGKSGYTITDLLLYHFVCFVCCPQTAFPSYFYMRACTRVYGTTDSATLCFFCVEHLKFLCIDLII